MKKKLISKGPESGKLKNRKSGIRTFENLPDFRTGRDVRLSPTILVLNQCSISAVFPIVRFAGDQKTTLTGESL